MASTVTPAELQALRDDPQALERKISEYVALRADAESKLRAVVDEVTAREYLERAEKKQSEAEQAVEEAKRYAREIRLSAENDVAAQRAAASETASQTIAQAEEDARRRADRIEGDLQVRLAETVALRAKLAAELENASKERESAARAIANNEQAAARHTAAADELVNIRQRLSSLVKEMTEIVGNAG